MGAPHGFEFKLTAEPDSVRAVSRALRSLLAAAGVDRDRVVDILLATTEVCANAVQHAYPDGEGVFRVEARLVPDRLEVVVRDHGEGIPAGRRPAVPRVGLPLSAAIATDLRIDTVEDVGTEVHLTFVLAAPAAGRLRRQQHRLDPDRHGPAGDRP
jgi:anti-sigma regulatory factor (Ser/Thr protein kinase)